MALEQNAVVRLSINAIQGSQSITNVLNFRVKAAAGVAAPATGLGIIASAWANAWDNAQANVYTWTGWQALQIRGTDVTYSPTTGKPSGGQTFEGVFSPTIVGDLADQALPPSTALVVSLRTGFAGPSKRGRAYIGGLTEGNNDAGSPTAGFITSAQGIVDGFWATYGVGGGNLDWEWGVWSYRIATDRYINPANPTQVLFGGNPQPSLAYTGITQTRVDPQWGQMRSRSYMS